MLSFMASLSRGFAENFDAGIRPVVLVERSGCNSNHIWLSMIHNLGLQDSVKRDPFRMIFYHAQSTFDSNVF